MTTKTTKAVIIALMVTILLPATTFGVVHAANPVEPKAKVMTPFGPWDADKVHEWDGKKPIDVDSIIDKWEREHPGEKSPAKKIIEERAKQKSAQANQPLNNGGNLPDSNGWSMSANYVHGTALSKFTGQWTVPSNPSQYTSPDVIFTFISLSSSDGAIIQPVLQYGSSAKCSVADWRIASWMVVSDTVWWASTCKDADPGDTIKGSLLRDGTTTSWAIKTENLSKGTSTQLSLDTSRTWRDADVAFETYGLPATCSVLPGDISYTNLQLNNGAVTPSWSELNFPANMWCGMDVVIVSATNVNLNNNN